MVDLTSCMPRKYDVAFFFRGIHRAEASLDDLRGRTGPFRCTIAVMY